MKLARVHVTAIDSTAHMLNATAKGTAAYGSMAVAMAVLAVNTKGK